MIALYMRCHFAFYGPSHVAALADHPQDHPSEQSGRYKHHGAFVDLFGYAGQFSCVEVKTHCQQHACGNAGCNPKPDKFHMTLVVGTQQIREHDADHEGGLERLAHGDE